MPKPKERLGVEKSDGGVSGSMAPCHTGFLGDRDSLLSRHYEFQWACMESTQETLERWGQNRCSRIEVGGLVSRNATAHKWKVTFRSLVIRETAFWRVHDLLLQSYTLQMQGMILGARILLRSALETTAMLIYLNHLTRGVLEGSENFHDFSKMTSRLLLGSKNRSTGHEAVNILTVLKHSEKRYPGVTGLFEMLSEAAHPNYEGMGFGYSRIDHARHVSNLGNYIGEMFGTQQESAMRLCMDVFEREYNNEWPGLFEELECWLVENDNELEKTKNEV